MSECPSGSLRIRGARVYRAVHRPPETADLVIVDGRVAPPDAPFPAHAPVLEADGATVLPGLVDAHMHLPHDRPARVLADYLRDGVTTARSMGNSFDELAAATAGTGPRARLFASGPSLTVPGGHPLGTVYAGQPELAASALVVRTPAEVDAAVGRLHDAGVAVVKTYLEDGRVFGTPVPTMTPALLAAVVAAAHARGLPVAIHCAGAEDFDTAVRAGADEVAHLSADFSKPWVPRDLGRRIAQAGALWTPTLFVTEAVTRSLARIGFAAVWAYAKPAFRRYLIEFRRAGGMLAAGTDAAEPFTHHAGALPRELELLVDVAGLSPAAALYAATVGGASALRRPDIGTLDPGALGDLVLFDGDPVRDLAAVRRVRATVVGGVVAYRG